jgi:hypothetical protein
MAPRATPWENIINSGALKGRDNLQPPVKQAHKLPKRVVNSLERSDPKREPGFQVDKVDHYMATQEEPMRKVGFQVEFRSILEGCHVP